MIIPIEASWKDCTEKIFLGIPETEASLAEKEEEQSEARRAPSLIHVPEWNERNIMDRIKEEYEQRQLMDFIVKG